MGFWIWPRGWSHIISLDISKFLAGKQFRSHQFSRPPGKEFLIPGGPLGNCRVGEVVWLRIVSAGYRKQHPKPL
jgi:hypothetical protein